MTSLGCGPRQPPLPLLLLLGLFGLLRLVPSCHGVSNDYAQVSTKFFASNEEEVQGVLGQRVVLPCEFIVAGIAQKKINVIWQKDKKTLTFNHEFVDDTRLSIAPTDINTRGKFDLQIRDLMASDEGLYRCIASFDEQFYIKNVTLLVKVPPTIDETKSSAPLKTLVEGDNYALVCQATGVPQPSIVWYKMVEQPHIEKIVVGEGPRFVMNNVSRKCDGTFICSASNGVHPSATKTFGITVNYKPTVSLVNEEISQRRGLSTMLMCVVTGNPIISYYWEHRSRRLLASGPRLCYSAYATVEKHCVYASNLAGAKHVVQMDLVINNLTAADFGQYACVASSPLGEDRKLAQVLELTSDTSDERMMVQQPEVFRPIRPEVVDPKPEYNTRRPEPDSPRFSTEADSVQNKHVPDSLTSSRSDIRGAVGGRAAAAHAPSAALLTSAATITTVLLTALAGARR